ncbi:hypothetical protein [Agrococcus casei]|uniref:Uncharacterized protein n=1 Tax=Agrococcus casei LMG 22410 TaxID=1255656 RepID=A0A1R4FBR6_9MICO|nr:hypothetical protein [Agrococcus casei]SJM53283.1 hypothetical protein CZ674_03720 [Agrococcus casei LMG 22410]
MGIALTEFLDTTRTPASGRYDIDYGGLSIPCSWESRGHHTTLVTFSGALTPNITELPAFVGWGTTRHLTCNVLMLSDPSLAIDPKLRLGWYAGCTALPRLQAKLTRVIRRFAARSRVVLFGASGGGFAALEHAPCLPGSLAIVSNPQTDILRYHQDAVEAYFKIAWGSNPSAASELPLEHEVVTRYSSPVAADVIYLQNSSDDFHIENHERPFRDSLHPSNRVHFVRGSFGIGHVGPSKEQFTRMFEAATSERRFSRVVAGVDAALR